jgi:hypothetical protein
MVDEDETQLILTTLFDIRTDVRHLIALLEEEEDDDAGEEEEG